jgi:hypothetical protein
MSKSNKDQKSPSRAESAPASCSASLVERQAQEPKYEMPTWGTSITTGELITLMLQREGTRDEAIEVLAQTLADLGVSGEEIAHWQKKPGICRDCAETDDRVHREWIAKAEKFPTTPIEMYRGYAKSDVQNASDQTRRAQD